MLLNLLTNAIHYAPGTDRVDVRLRRVDGEAEIQVQDYGPGIAAEVLPRIFDKFIRGSTPAAPGASKGEGTGLGLAIAKGIVAAHGGTVGAESPAAAGRGTRITLAFPREAPR